MSDDTTAQHIADLREDVAKILRNQMQLEGLIHVIGRQVFQELGSSVAQFNLLAKTWDVEAGTPRK